MVAIGVFVLASCNLNQVDQTGLLTASVRDALNSPATLSIADEIESVEYIPLEMTNGRRFYAGSAAAPAGPAFCGKQAHRRISRVSRSFQSFQVKRGPAPRFSHAPRAARAVQILINISRLYLF